MHVMVRNNVLVFKPAFVLHNEVFAITGTRVCPVESAIAKDKETAPPLLAIFQNVPRNRESVLYVSFAELKHNWIICG